MTPFSKILPLKEQDTRSRFTMELSIEAPVPEWGG